MDTILGPAVAGGLVAITLGVIKVAENLSKNGKRGSDNGFKEDIKATRQMVSDGVSNARLERAAINTGISRLTEETKAQTSEIKDMAKELRDFTAVMKANLSR